MADKPWFVIYCGRYVGDEPYFFDEDEFVFVPLLKANWKVIRDEMLAIIEQHPDRLKPYVSSKLIFPPRHWQTIGFYFWSWRLHRNLRLAPKTHAVLKQIPHLSSAALSMLEPGSNINPHQGDTNAQVKVHLGLVIPEGLPQCGFQVGDQVRAWDEGETLLFCDAHSHTAWNESNKRRLLFIVDVIRPEFQDRNRSICVHVLASTLLQIIYQRFQKFGTRPGALHHILHFVARGAISLALPIQRYLLRLIP
jgi:aspartyl/asparaginyl beta-hydroxylase (cupin superfamily)